MTYQIHFSNQLFKLVQNSKLYTTCPWFTLKFLVNSENAAYIYSLHNQKKTIQYVDAMITIYFFLLSYPIP